MQIYDTEHEAQKYLLRMVPNGHRFWTSGVIDSGKLDGLKEKFAELYGTRLPSWKKHWRKQQGLANALAVAVRYPPERHIGGLFKKARWFLIATEGLAPVHEQEKLQDAWSAGGRVTWNDYLLNQTTRPRAHGGGLHWSWWMKPTVVKELTAYAASLVKAGEAEMLRQFFAMQRARPMHSGIRSQVGRLIKGTHKHWTRMHPGTPWPGPDPDAPLPFYAGF